jgi:flavin-dependent dehydrogenase
VEDDEKQSDIAVIGGGPAGTACALEARRRGLSVVLWERERFPRHKVCGEFLSSESLEWLKGLVPKALERAAPIVRGEFISVPGRTYSFALPCPARGLSRKVLDEALWSATAAAGAQVQEGVAVRRLRKLSRAGEGENWEIESADGGRQYSRAVVVACGRWWTLQDFPSPAPGAGKRAGPWLGAKAHFRGVTRSDAVEMYFFPGGYCGLAPIEDGMYNACCLIHRDRLNGVRPGDFSAWLKSVARHPHLDGRLRGATQVSETVTTAPLRPARRAAAQQGALLAGDAAGFLDPFTGDGISMALASGRLAADELAQRREEGKDLREAARSFERRLGRAVRRSYRLAGLLRLLVSAPAGVQESVAGALPWLGAKLVLRTRWRDDSVSCREQASPRGKIHQREENA